MRIGIFGGSFDPVHFGHLILAELVRDQLRLEQLLLIPAAVSPLKGRNPIASDQQRLEMLRLALAGHETILASDIEIARGGKSYTVDTLAQLARDCPDSERFLIVGGDSLESFAQWREPSRICELAMPVMLRRAGLRPISWEVLRDYMSPARYRQVEAIQFPTPLIEISSSDIRRRVAEGRTIRFMLPRGVEKYIETAGLYRTRDEEPTGST